MVSRDEHRFHERLWPGAGLWAATVVFAVCVGVAVLPASPLVALLAAVVVLAVGVLLGLLTAPVVTVSEGTLRAGRARIPVHLLGELEVLDAVGTRAALGPDLDARAYVCLRGWIRTAVKVEVVDPRDPAPYWFVSTRRADELAAALVAARASTAD
ncbi:MAG: DUF3093 domain-containing protein [Actinomycetales bacterium]|nr:DUF3093 domain-containing protein [Actinomycetales bacterium]